MAGALPTHLTAPPRMKTNRRLPPPAAPPPSPPFLAQLSPEAPGGRVRAEAAAAVPEPLLLSEAAPAAEGGLTYGNSSRGSLLAARSVRMPLGGEGRGGRGVRSGAPGMGARIDGEGEEQATKEGAGHRTHGTNVTYRRSGSNLNSAYPSSSSLGCRRAPPRFSFLSFLPKKPAFSAEGGTKGQRQGRGSHRLSWREPQGRDRGNRILCAARLIKLASGVPPSPSAPHCPPPPPPSHLSAS